MYRYSSILRKSYSLSLACNQNSSAVVPKIRPDVDVGGLDSVVVAKYRSSALTYVSNLRALSCSLYPRFKTANLREYVEQIVSFSKRITR